MRLEVVERLETVRAAVLRLACRRAESREFLRAQRAAVRTFDGAAKQDRPRLIRRTIAGTGWRDAGVGELASRFRCDPVGAPRRRQRGDDAQRGISDAC